MSEKNFEGKRTARERLIQEREAQKARDKRRRALVVGAAVVGVLGLAAVVGVVAANSGDGKGDEASDGNSGQVVVPAGAVGAEKVALPVGATDAPSLLTVYEDMRCPACGMFENSMRDTINKLEKAGKLRAEYHLVSFIDKAVTGNGSKYAANALGCAQGVGKFHEYHDVLFRNQPEETDDAFGKKSHLLDLASKVPGLRGTAFDKCVDEGTHAGWVTKVQKDFDKSKYKATPTVLLNGEPIYPQKGSEQITPANLVKWVEAANRGKPAGTRTPQAPGAGGAPGAGSGAAPSSGPGSVPGSAPGSAPSSAPGSVPGARTAPSGAPGAASGPAAVPEGAGAPAAGGGSGPR
ncbi:DsbA family protein [Streptomyces candidus]|uniref:Protein-disulfide isomerase n=1 Tax=Streptomyces candidus TaxID=67283 RepID=A0A7X0LMQ9_9ACTN|nr:thioredoxin domain-containing protein [Streptomyces candidus]MBB6433679.1 protein-disulfide isomerase [Streptomyces candidus]